MASIILTDIAIRNIIPHKFKQFEVFDKKARGLGVRVSPGGTKSFVVFYRIGRQNRRLTLGAYPTIKLADARQMAQEAMRKVAKGIDPQTEKIKAREAYPTSLVPVVVSEFIENHAKRNTRSWKETERILQNEFARPWRKLPIHQITKRTINSVLDEIVGRSGPSAANHAFSAIRKFFNWCVERGYVDHAASAGMKAPAKVVERERVLSDDELVAIWTASDKIGWPFGPLTQLLMLSGQRRAEVGGLRWSELDLSNALLEIPPGSQMRTHKSDRRHWVPLSPPVVKLLTSLPRVHDDLAFPARGKDRPVSGFSKWKRELDQLSGVKNWTLHDLRRTAATGMGALKVPRDIVDMILNHRGKALSGVAGIYNKYDYLDERREALELWAERVGQLVQRAQEQSSRSGPSSVKPVPLGPGRLPTENLQSPVPERWSKH